MEKIATKNRCAPSGNGVEHPRLGELTHFANARGGMRPVGDDSFEQCCLLLRCAFGGLDAEFASAALRDDEQSPGASMNVEEKLKIAEMLEALSVDVIEAGFMTVSQGETVNEIAKLIRNAAVCVLVRSP